MPGLRMAEALAPQPNPAGAGLAGYSGVQAPTESASRALPLLPHMRSDTGCGRLPDAGRSGAEEIDPGLVRWFRISAIAAGILVAAISVVSLFGWFAGIPLLTSVNSAWISMKANTAVGFVAAGCSLAMLASQHPGTISAVRLSGAFLAALGCATLVEYAFHWNSGLDRLLIAEPPGTVGTIYPGRMAFVTALSFSLSGLSLVSATMPRTDWIRVSGLLALPVVLFSLVAFLGYLFGARELYGVAGNLDAMAAGAAVAFFLLGSALSLCTLEHNFLHGLASPGPGGVMLRRLLPGSLLFPAFIVWLQLRGQHEGLFSTIEFGAALAAVAMIAASFGALYWCAALLGRLDRKRSESARQVFELNKSLADKIRLLEDANAELETISYATSHVLRAPLRALDGFSRILIESHAGQLDGEGIRLLNVVRSSARDMDEVVGGILEFLRLGREKLIATVVDMTEAARAAAEELEPATKGRAIHIEISPMPTATGDRRLLQRVWMQLIDNAVKFANSASEPRIEVGAVSYSDETAYFVRDNGVGFDVRYAGRLFGVFSRLHGSDFPGNGMGLAIVKRIVVSRHGGRVWAQGKPNEGATFYFSLPARETADA
jgi:signal transduction histidine kinase